MELDHSKREMEMEELELCNECGLCLDVCPVYKATQRDEFSPIGKLEAARAILSGEEVTPEMVESIYNCPQCHLCDDVCPQGISITGIVHESRVELVKRGLGPLEAQNRVIEGIGRLGNSVNGDPSRRLEWLPEEFPRKESSTLLYLGCLPSYLVKECASSTYLVLKRLGVDFMILEDEGCCGLYFYDSGRIDLAKEKFEENASRFKKLGITRIIVPCAGCYRCFKRYYPQLLGDVDFETVHITEILPSLLVERGIKPQGIEVTYQDPCRLGRMEGLYDEPRDILRLCGVEVREMAENRGNAACCGAGAGVRSIYRDLSFKMATTLLDEAPLEHVVTSCPFCDFNLSYASQKAGGNKKITYITEIVLDSVS